MQTRLTELLGIEHPVMLAGMGGVSYCASGGRGVRGRRLRLPRRLDHDHANGWSPRSPRSGRPPTSRSASTCSPPCPGTWSARSNRSSRAVPRCSWPGSVCPPTWSTCATASDLLVVNMCGKVDHARRALDAGCDIVVAQGTEAGGHTGLVATMPLVPQIVDAVGDRHPGGGGRRHLRRSGPGRRPGPRGRRRLGRHPVHRHPRGPRRGRLQGRPAPDQGGRHHHQPGLLRARPCGWCATSTPSSSTSTPTSSSRSRPSSGGR